MIKQTMENEKTVTRYLFGELNQTERDELEDRLFLDEDFGLSVNAIENDLIDDYLRENFSLAKRAKFEEQYLITESRRTRLEAVKILHSKVFNSASVVFTEPKKIRLRQSATN